MCIVNIKHTHYGSRFKLSNSFTDHISLLRVRQFSFSIIETLEFKKTVTITRNYPKVRPWCQASDSRLKIESIREWSSFLREFDIVQSIIRVIPSLHDARVDNYTLLHDTTRSYNILSPPLSLSVFLCFSLPLSLYVYLSLSLYIYIFHALFFSPYLSSLYRTYCLYLSLSLSFSFPISPLSLYLSISVSLYLSPYLLSFFRSLHHSLSLSISLYLSPSLSLFLSFSRSLSLPLSSLYHLLSMTK